MANATAAAVKSRLLTPPFRVSFPQVWEKASYNGGTPRFSLTGLFYPEQWTPGDKEKWKAILVKLNEVCKAFPDFKGKGSKEMKENRDFKWPFHKGDEKDYEGYGDPKMIFCSMANSKRRPQIINRDGSAITSENSEEFYAGCWARASVNPYAFNNIGKGLALGLGNIKKLKDDKSFEGFTDADEDFGGEEEDFADDGLDGEDFGVGGDDGEDDGLG